MSGEGESWLDDSALVPRNVDPRADTVSLPPSSPELTPTRVVPSGGADEPAAVEPGQGRRIGRFVLERELGRGGMGVVWQAFDPELNRHVALKLLLGRFKADEEMLARFLAEAQITSQLQHPAIVSIHDLGRTDEGELYYTMQLVQGSTLTDIVHDAFAADPIHDERASRFRLLQTFVLLCRAVDYAHTRGVLHRDLKPDNVMIGRFGQAYVMDWGVAKVLGAAEALRELRRQTERDPQHLGELALELGFDRVVEVSGKQDTQHGMIVGTPAYMAPEQAEGDAAKLGPSVDVYSLGGLLYYILAGRHPHVGPPTLILRKVAMKVPPAPPSKYRADVPPQLEEACLAALDYDPRQRTHSAEALATAVEAWLEGRSLSPARAEDATFLRSYSARIYRKPSVTVDVVFLSVTPTQADVLLTRRTAPPQAGAWALPGGFVRMDEDLEEAARRILQEKASGPPDADLVQIGAYGAPDRDPRTRVITVAFLAVIDRGHPLPPAEDPREPSRWFRVDAEGSVLPLRGEPEPPEVAFDHERIIADALRLVRWTRGTD